MTHSNALVHSAPSMTNANSLVHPSHQMSSHSMSSDAVPSSASDPADARSKAGSVYFGVHSDDPGRRSVPYAGQTRMQLTISSGIANARVRIDPDASELISILADGLETRLIVSPKELRLSWPKTWGTVLRSFLETPPDIEIVLHAAVEWSFSVRGGLSQCSADFAAGKLASIDVQGGIGNAHFDLPVPTASATVRVAGGVSELSLRRPKETGVGLHIAGGVSTLQLDEQRFGTIGGDSRLVSGEVHGDTPRYSVEISGGASGIRVTGH